MNNVYISADDLLPSVTARSAIVMEAATGKVLYSRDGNARRYPASTTKIMTLIVALEKGNLDDIVTVSRNASQTEGSTIWLEPGEKIRLADLLYGMMLVSGNDATVAVAEHIAGSVDAFAKLMTDKAHEIGATNTNFVNSSGLPDLNHYTTAYDLAKITAYGYRNPMFEQIVSTKEKQIPWADKGYNRELRNENRMLWLYKGGNGVKTGYTNAAGRCLVTGAKQNGVQLITVVLDSLYMWNDSIAMLDYGFRHVKSVTLVKKGAVLKQVKVITGDKSSLSLQTNTSIEVPVVDDEKADFRTVIDAPDRVNAAIKKGDIVGKVSVFYENNEIASANLVATESIGKKSFFLQLCKYFASTVDYLKHTLLLS
ncbi:MAG: D-alanyl-D-alanine carboxypeptidase family protein [Selenomonadaceae bacterium]